MILEEIVNKFLESPKRMIMGSGKLSRRWKCTREDIYIARVEERKILKGRDKKSELPKILIFDIETTPLEAYVYQKSVWKANIGHDKVISEWFCLTWAAKWLFSDETMSDRLTSSEVKAEDDGRIVRSLWKLLDEADMIVAHNGDGFDVPNMNTRFLVNGIKPASPYQKIDTLKVAKREFGFTHNGLDALAKTFGMEGKISTGFELWRRCKKGETAALKEMEVYNRQDVDLLEDVYLKLRPWIKLHPSAALFIESEEKICPSCGHDHLVQKGNYMTQVSKFETYQCQKCGAFSRSRKSVVTKEIKENLLVSISR